MFPRTIAICAAAAVLCAAAPPAITAAVAATPTGPNSYDGLMPVEARRVDSMYVLPGADFRGYTKVMLDPTEVAFQRNWLRDFNRNTMSVGQRISDADAARILEQARTGFEEIFTRAYTEAGYQVVTQPGEDVLRVRTGVLNLSVTAPDQMSAGRSRTFARDAGQATVVFEVRDSLSGAVLGRAIDSRTAGDNGTFIRNRVTNRADFERLFRIWAQIGVSGMAELKARSPFPAS